MHPPARSGALRYRRESHRRKSHRRETGGWSAGHPLLVCLHRLWLLAAIGLVSGCTWTPLASTPPIAKIGLIAPFEGLYRESGYAALAALRAALADCAPPEIGVVPVALDDSADPAEAARAAQKLLVDPAVVAVVGPFTPATVAATQPVLGEQPRPWIAPLAVDPAGGFASPRSSAWLTELLNAAQLEHGRGRILIVNLPETMAVDWTGDADAVRIEASTGSTLPDDGIRPGDGVLWLGDAAQGAAWLNSQHAAGRFPAFWLANPVGGDVLAAHLAAANAGELPVSPAARWLVWGHSEYNRLLASRAPNLPITQLTYTATCTALDQAFGVTSAPPRTSSLSWEVQHQDLGAVREPAP